MEDMRKLLGKDLSTQELDLAISRLDSAISKIEERLDENAASASKMTLVSNGVKKKLIATMVAISVFLLSLTLCTYAYFTSTTNAKGNRISTGTAEVVLVNVTNSSSNPGMEGNDDAIAIFPGYIVEKTVYAKNNSSFPIYVRAKIDSEIALDERYADREGEIDLSLIEYDIDLENWTEVDGYYYYNTPLRYLQSTTNLLSNITFSREMGNVYKDSSLKVTILLEAVQANGNGDNVFEASGWSSVSEGGAS